MTDGSIRASDNDRETVVAVLREAFSEGRLTLDEFDERTSAAYTAKTWGDLRELTTDLPVQPVLSAGQQDNALRDGSQQDNGALPFPLIPPAGPDQTRPGMMRTVPPRRPRPFGRLLPVVAIWLVIAAAGGAAHVVAVLVVVLVILLGMQVIGGRRP